MGTLIKSVTITFDGKEKKYKEEYDFLNIVLKQQLLMPNELTFTMEKKELEESVGNEYDTTKEVMGSTVVCTIITEYFNKKDEQHVAENSLVFEGIVTNVNVYRRSGPFSNQMIDVQAFSKDFLLMDHKHCYSYEKMLLKDIVAKTLSPYKIPNQIDPWTQEEIPYTVQYNESNYQFLTRLAIRYGEWMYNDGVQWIFGTTEHPDPITLEPRNDILNFRFYAELKHHKVKHAHHDYLKYKNTTKSDSEFPDLKKSNHKLTHIVQQKSSELFTKETFQHLQCSNPEGYTEDNPALIDNYELNISAHTQLFGEKMRQCVCSCSTVRSDLKIGSIIQLNDFFFQEKEGDDSKKLADLMITEISHYTEVGGEYRNFFMAYPVGDEEPPYFQSDLFPIMSPQRAKVMDNKDPEKMGRIRVQFLWQEEQEPDLMTPWIRIAQPHGGNDKGFYFIPEIDEEVMVEFENGNAEKPFVVGTLYHGKQHPGKKWPTDSNDIKAIRTRNGHTIEIHDEGNDGFIRIYDHEKENYILTFSTDKKLIKLESTGNIELYAGSDIIMEAGHDIKMKAKNNKDVDVENKLTVKVGSSKTVSAGSITESAGGEMKLTSATHEQTAKGAMKLEAGAILEAQGAIVKIN